MIGDCGKVLFKKSEQLNATAVVWLDGYYSSGIKVRGEMDCPIFGEIDAIFSFKDLNNNLLIDDAQLYMGKEIIQKLNNHILSKNNDYRLVVKDDVVKFTKYKFNKIL
jgi:hypothetical protein